MNLQYMSMAELNLGFGMPVLNSGEHFLKVGGRAKVMIGLAAAYLQSNTLNFQFYETNELDADTIVVRANADFDYGYSDNFPLDSNNTQGNYTPRLSSFPTVGLDIGAVYEWRPNWQQYRYDMDGQTGIERPDQNKYKLRVGFSLLDIGRVRFRQGDLSRNVNVQVVDTIDIDTLDFENTQEYDNFVDRYSTRPEEYFDIWLPLTLSFQVDYNIYKGFYANLTTWNTFRVNERGLKALNMYSLTPRFDHKWFSIGIPLSVNGFGRFALGTGLRLGPVYVGSNTLMTWAVSDEVSDFDFYMAFQIPIFKRVPRDRDNDRVSDKRDLCREVPGVWAFMGCPDTDADSVQDSEDSCPTEPGLARFGGCPDTDRDNIPDREDACPQDSGLMAFQGCPDRDGDQIIDKNDECPDEPGLAQFQGCPDRDADGVMDRADRCPDVAGLTQFRGCPDSDGDNIPDVDDSCATIAGLAAFAGCPDTDNDGIQDREDQCPTKPGPAAQQGCPDTDGDGLHDHKDNCPEEPGPITNNGCPVRDTDRDGVPDKDDLCPTEPGPASNNGCPPPQQDEEVQEVLRTAFDNLEFETGRDIIQNQSFASLLELAQVLKKRPNYQIKISGHTDNVGDDASNMTLSRKRAEAVKKFLTDNGVDEGRIIAQGFGESRPVASNATPEGRAKNRRVELEVLQAP
jgi:outer membrane protein OmpA-like peptidoglycan-associated protein